MTKALFYRILTVVAFLLTFAIGITGCTSSTTGNNETSTSNTGDMPGSNVSVIGSTSVGPLMQQLADEFSDKNPNILVDVQQVGSSQGIKAAIDGTAQIGMSSRDLKDSEKGTLTEHVMALDGIAIVTNPSNPVKDFTMEQVQKIFKGEITNWKEVGGPDSPIIVMSREDGAGTRAAFEEMLDLQIKNDDRVKSLVTKKALIFDSSGAIKTNVASKHNAIGYISLAAVDDTVVSISIDGVECTPETIRDKSYPLGRSFILVTKGKITGNAQKFLDYVMSDEAQEIISEDYISAK